MPTNTHQLFACITPVDTPCGNRIFSTWSMIRHYLMSQFLGFLYGLASSLLPMIGGFSLGAMIGAPIAVTFALAVLLTWVGGAAALFGMYFFGFPALIFERRICRKFLKTVERHSNPVISPSDPTTRVVELVPRERWRKRFCLDTATDLMMIRIDSGGVWMKGDRYRYELPAESILAAECESYRPHGCSFDIYMAVIYVRTEQGPIELPVSYRDHGWRDFRRTRRHDQTMDLVEQVTAIATGHLMQSPPTVAGDDCQLTISSDNPYASPAIINESVYSQ